MSITKISPSVVDFDAGITISTADNTTQLTLKSTDADANTGPVLNLQRDSGSPADNDYIGNIKLQADNDAGEVLDHVSILGQIVDASDGTEDAKLTTYVLTAGTVRNALEINPTEVVINEDSIDRDFRVESDNSANALFVQGSDGFVGIGRTPANILDIEFADGSNVTAGNIGDNSVTGINIINTTNSNGAGTHIKMMANNGSNMTAIAHEQVATNSSQLLFYTENAGTFAQKLRINEVGTMFSAAGLAFGGDTAAANQLDDYEEGNWTPVMQGSTTNGSPTMSAQNGSYTKVGRIVHLTFHLTVTNLGSAAGSIQISGIPFNTASNSNKHITTGSCMVDALDFHNSYYWIVPYASDGVSLITLYMSGDNIGWTPPDVDGSFGIIGSLSYIAA